MDGERKRKVDVEDGSGRGKQGSSERGGERLLQPAIV